jgi:hypothetical protein
MYFYLCVHTQLMYPKIIVIYTRLLHHLYVLWTKSCHVINEGQKILFLLCLLLSILSSLITNFLLKQNRTKIV